jgi:hypothetical protein
MSSEHWHEVWVNTLVVAGIDRAVAEDVFEFCLGNQDIDLSSDPRLMAQVFCSGINHIC